MVTIYTLLNFKGRNISIADLSLSLNNYELGK